MVTLRNLSFETKPTLLMGENGSDGEGGGANGRRDFIHSYLAQVLAGLTLVVLIGGGTYVVTELSALNSKVDVISNQLEDVVYGFTFISGAIRELHAGQPVAADALDRLDDRFLDLHQRVRQVGYSENGYDELHWPKPVVNPSKLLVTRSDVHENAWAINLVDSTDGLSDVVSVLSGAVSRIEEDGNYWKVEIEGDEDVLTLWRLSEVSVENGDPVAAGDTIGQVMASSRVCVTMKLERKGGMGSLDIRPFMLSYLAQEEGHDVDHGGAAGDHHDFP